MDNHGSEIGKQVSRFTRSSSSQQNLLEQVVPAFGKNFPRKATHCNRKVSVLPNEQNNTRNPEILTTEKNRKHTHEAIAFEVSPYGFVDHGLFLKDKEHNQSILDMHLFDRSILRKTEKLMALHIHSLPNASCPLLGPSNEFP